MLIQFKPVVDGNWPAAFAAHGCAVLTGDPLVLLREPGVVLVSNCSKTKGTQGDVAVPKKFYLGDNCQRAIAFAEQAELPYAILSDLYGLHWYDVALPFYDIHPSQVTEKTQLAAKVKEVCDEHGVHHLLYYNTSPVRARFYIDLILLAGLTVSYTTKLDRAIGFFA